jgi:hypothetical protein
MSAYSAFFSHTWETLADGSESHPFVCAVYNFMFNNDLDVWFDEVELTDHIQREISEGVKSSGCMVCFLSQGVVICGTMCSLLKRSNHFYFFS